MMKDKEEKKTNIENVEQSEKPQKEEKVKQVDFNKYQKALSDIEALKSEVTSWKNKYYMAFADTDNLRKSIEKDQREAIRFRAEGFIEKLMPALDGFNMALMMKPKNEEMKAFLDGFTYVYNNIMQAMESEGVSEISPKIGDKFNVDTMHALDTVEKEGEENLVVNVLGKGYKLHDRIIRSALVYVSRKPEEKEKQEDEKQEKSSSEETNKMN